MQCNCPARGPPEPPVNIQKGGAGTEVTGLLLEIGSHIIAAANDLVIRENRALNSDAAQILICHCVFDTRGPEQTRCRAGPEWRHQRRRWQVSKAE